MTVKKLLSTMRVIYHIKQYNMFSSWYKMVRHFIVKMDSDQRREALYYASVDYRNTIRRKNMK